MTGCNPKNQNRRRIDSRAFRDDSVSENAAPASPFLLDAAIRPADSVNPFLDFASASATAHASFLARASQPVRMEKSAEEVHRLQTIAIILALVTAPMALFAGAWQCACSKPACTMACCQNDKCQMQQQERCQGSAMELGCDCMQFPAAASLAPLPQTVLPRPIPQAAVRAASRAAAPAPVAILSGFLQAPFHPPRG